MKEENPQTDLNETNTEFRTIDGWPTWLEIRRGVMVLILMLAPAVILSTYLPRWIQSYHITGEAIWGLKRIGMPDEVIQPMLKMRGPTYFFKSSLLEEVEKNIPPEFFKKYHKKIKRSLTIHCLLRMTIAAIITKNSAHIKGNQARKIGSQAAHGIGWPLPAPS